MRINYKHKIAQLITTALVVVLLSLNAFAGSVPPYMNYQGLLKDASTGDSLATGDYQIKFSLYDAPEGTPGAVEVWSQIIEPVKVVDGHFSVLLGGEENSLPDSFNSPDRFIEVHVGRVGDAPENLVKLSNRQRIVGVGYAFQAEKAINAITAEGLVDNAILNNVTISSGTIAKSTVVKQAENAKKIDGWYIEKGAAILVGTPYANTAAQNYYNNKWVSFNTKFSEPPTVVASVYAHIVPHLGVYAQVQNITNLGFEIFILSPHYQAGADRHFKANWIAIGN